jgi:dihydroxyacetone kinase-like protein
MALTSLDLPHLRSMLLAMADRIIENEPLLSEADRNLGDGDHGIGMARGFTAAKEKLQEEFPSPDKMLVAVGSALISTMGGASGVVFGTIFRSGGKAVAGKDTLGSVELADFLAAGAEGVMARGGAKPGDKTMVDALLPAAEKAREVAGQPLAKAASAIAEAAAAGKEASKAMIATMGRAKSLGEGSIGFPDAGAVSVTLLLEAARDYIHSAG